MPSEHAAVLLVWRQPPVTSQVSVVQTLPSSHEMGVNTRGTLRAVETAGPRRGGGSSVTDAIAAASIAARVATSMLAAAG